MAKSKSKTSSSKLPKRIAGVKVPKNIRTTGDKLMDVLHHPLIADFAAAALLAAAKALRENEGVRKAGGKIDASAITLGSVAAGTAKPKAKKKKK
jgi:hypothetical protein